MKTFRRPSRVDQATIRAVRVTFARTGFPPALAIATDGDADRFGIADGDGTFIQLN
ncbi:MAG TPA: hypothetical protein VGF96_09245 [Terracidiphilus sp.]|jgi:phosphomannomutase